MRPRPTSRSPHGHQPPERRDQSRHRQLQLLLAALVSAAFLLAGCSSGAASSPSTTSSSTTSIASTPTGAPAASGANTGAGAVTRPGSGSGSQTGGRSAGNYTVAFAECMRAHGVPKFPDPNGSGTELGPDSGIDPTSATFQAALNGPCQSLAPAGWVSSGPVSNGGAS
jgi:type IV secretory pathway TrbL component